MVKPGKKYRVRVIGQLVLSYIQLALEGHTMMLFEVDVRGFSRSSRDLGNTDV